MGMQGPLTAQALGRSPFDDVIQGEGQADPREPPQQYDQGGRPVNAETTRINRDIIRSHNEVMMVIGVAEPENPNTGPEADLQRRHERYEESIGIKLAGAAKRCVEGVGVFGVNGLRERILIYKRYSHIPFWDLFKQSRGDFSLTRDVLPAVPASIINGMADSFVDQLWLGQRDKTARRCVRHIWSYLRVHLELFIAMQRLGLVPSQPWLPPPSFFLPFSSASPIMTPSAPNDLSLPSLVRWLGGVALATAPFVVWCMSQRLLRDWRPQIWAYVFKRLPSTALRRKAAPPPLSPSVNEVVVDEELPPDAQGQSEEPVDPEPPETMRRPSILSTQDDYASDDDNEGVRATLISFDVEATESSADAPQGLWSAELRPSVGLDPRLGASAAPIYFDTLLTRFPALIATHIFTNTLTRILIAPYEATALRLVARAVRVREGLPCADIHSVNMLTGLNWVSAMNYLGVELLHLVLSSEVWAVFTGLSQWYHMSQEEFKERETRMNVS